MAETPANTESTSAWTDDSAPCVYCGQVVPRDADRCPQCRTSFSQAVRKASREVIGPWYYLDPKNPSGRGVTLETLLKMIEKGRLRPDSIVRGPTTHQDWLYAAETPRLAKYLGLCPHCFGEAKPEDTYCVHCQLNMNQRPADARPGIPPYLVKPPRHLESYEMEMKLAADAASAPADTLSEEPLVEPPPAAPAALAAPPPPPKLAAPAPGAKAPAPAPRAEEPVSAATPTSAVTADLVSAVSEKRSGVGLAARRKRPRIFVTLILTWATLAAAVLLIWAIKPELFGGRPPDGSTHSPDDAWLNDQLARVRDAEKGGDYPRAITILQSVIEKTTDAATAQTMEFRIRDLRQRIQKAEEDRRAALAKLVEHLRRATALAEKQDYETALATLGNIGEEDRKMLAGTGVSVPKMEADFRDKQARWIAEKAEKDRLKQQEEELATQINLVQAAEKAGKLKDALDLCRKIAAKFPPELVQKQLNLQTMMDDLQTRLAASPASTNNTDPANKTPAPTKSTAPSDIAKEITDIQDQATALEKQEKFEQARLKLEEIKQKYEEKYWPEKLNARIEQLKAREEALKFFGIGGTKK